MNETKRKPFAVWTVGETDYRLKLDTATIAELETKFKCNLLTLLESSGSMPGFVSHADDHPWGDEKIQSWRYL